MRALGLIQAALRAAPPGSLLLVAACQLQRVVPAEKLDRAEPTDSAQSAPASAPDSSTPSTDSAESAPASAAVSSTPSTDSAERAAASAPVSSTPSPPVSRFADCDPDEQYPVCAEGAAHGQKFRPAADR